MKRCPYCAEEIQDEAVICRYCFKRVKHNPYRMLIIILILLSAATLAKMHQREISRTVTDVKIFFKDMRHSFREFYNTVKSIPESLRMIGEYKNKVESLSKMTDLEPDLKNQGGGNE